MIIWPVCFATWGEILRAPARLALMALFVGSTVLQAAFLHNLPLSKSGLGALGVIVLGAGSIGRPVSDGTLALLFSRPIRRSSYVLTRWFAAWSAAGALAIVCDLLLAAERVRSGAAMDWEALGIACVEDGLTAAGTGAVLISLSAATRGVGDAVAIVVLRMGAGVFEAMGSKFSEPLLSQIGSRVGEWMAPELNLVEVLRWTPTSWYAVTAYLSTVTLCLAAAIELVNRKEVSYASSGE